MYLPGVTQKDYIKPDPVELKVVKLDSTQTLLPYKYYQLPFCKPEGGIKDMIGEHFANSIIFFLNCVLLRQSR